jgi:hypothetical protein
MNTMDFNKGKRLPMKSSLRRWSMVSYPTWVFREAEPVFSCKEGPAVLRISVAQGLTGHYLFSKKILPGFRILFGSSAFLIFRMAPRACSPTSSPR